MTQEGLDSKLKVDHAVLLYLLHINNSVYYLAIYQSPEYSLIGCITPYAVIKQRMDDKTKLKYLETYIKRKIFFFL